MSNWQKSINLLVEYFLKATKTLFMNGAMISLAHTIGPVVASHRFMTNTFTRICHEVLFAWERIWYGAVVIVPPQHANR